jgi:hypothetical protein
MRSSTAIPGGLFLLFTALLALSWWWAGGASGERPQTTLDELLWKAEKRAGPQDPSLCAAPAVARPPPPVDSPFGVHLFATTPLGVVRPINGVIQIADMLGLPPASAKPSATGSNTALQNPSAAGSDPLPKNETNFDDVQSVTTLLEEFRRAFGAMPTGELNDEIVRRLQGENPRGIAVLPKTHPAIVNGELIDRYGTPYRFHPESAWDMQVRSAGPDKRMWTSDDIISENLSSVLVQK